MGFLGGQDGVVEMEVCVWHEGGYDRFFVPDPRAIEISEALNALNGADRNDLYLRSSSGRWMGFGGGPDRVIVTYSESFEGPHYEAFVSDDGTPEGFVTLVVGGQEVELPGRRLIPLGYAVAAALSFTETGDRPDVLSWD